MLSKSIDFIKYQLDRARKVQRKLHAKGGVTTAPIEAIIVQFEECLAAMAQAESRLEQLPAVAERDRTILTPDDVNDLPPELRAQLSLSESDYQDFELRRMISECGGIMSLDHILIEIFRRSREVQDRGKLNARLYRMVQKGLLYDVPKRRGVYSVSQPSNSTPTPTDHNPSTADGGANTTTT